MAGELAKDDPVKQPKVKTHDRILDKIINSIDCRFKNNGEPYKDIVLLYPINFDEVKQGVPLNKSKKLCELLARKLLPKYYKRKSAKRIVIKTDETDEEDKDDFERDGGFDLINKKCKSCRAIYCYYVIQKYNMYSEAYSALGNA
ncbi:unnamed protein product [Psylliodes chrysocephalus]|uniref:Uncharacterized protein n=1 Tax=Psylliodes chrysocephalus TaxID=3402493 RepID=A0A9P0DAR3_9CUCU|nr:unnamed protein product [Psylliodes chrysocephala]